MSHNLKQYRGTLTPKQAAEGISLARANAARLIADAELLEKSSSYGSATALAILAIEEIGKIQCIKIILLQKTEAKVREAWKEFRSHRFKNVQWILPHLVAQGARTLKQLKPAASPEAEHTEMLDIIKQLSLYVDCYGNNSRWSSPKDIEPELTKAIIATARILNRDNETTEKELQLWVDIVGPHYGLPSMVAALLEFQKQMFEIGLSPTSPEQMAAFITGKPKEAK